VPRIPTLASLLGYGDEMKDKSIVPVLLIPSFNLVFTSFFALTGLLILGAKRSVRGGSGGRSAEAQEAFRTTWARLFSGMALFLCLLLTVTSLNVIRVAQGQVRSGGLSILLVAVAMIAYIVVNFIRVFTRLGQGGALLESGSAEAPLTGGLADDADWILGVMYVDRNDPSLMVESRFLGYTFNLGNRLALVILSIFFTACLGLTGLTLMEIGLFS